MVSKKTARVLRITIFAALLIAGVSTAFKLGLKDKLSAALHWVDRNKIPGVGVTVATYVISCSECPVSFADRVHPRHAYNIIGS
jgi:hypothetical protein